MSQAPILDRPVLGDRGATNVITFGLFIVCGLTSGVWFAFFGAFERNLRLGVPLALVGLVVVFFTLFRIDSVGGEMAPHFVWRFADASDHALEVPAVDSMGGIDLTTTNPWDFPQFLDRKSVV